MKKGQQSKADTMLRGAGVGSFEKLKASLRLMK